MNVVLVYVDEPRTSSVEKREPPVVSIYCPASDAYYVPMSSVSFVFQSASEFLNGALILMVAGAVVWSTARWIRSRRSPYIWMESSAVVEEAQTIVEIKGWAAWLSRTPYAVSWSGEYMANGTRYPIRGAIMHSKISPGMNVPIVYLQERPSVWRYRSAQQPGVESHIEAKALILWFVVLPAFVYASLVIGLHDAGYGWQQSLLFWK